MDSGKFVPFFRAYCLIHNIFNFMNHNSQLWYRKFRIRRDTKAVIIINHELMPGTCEWPCKTQLTKPFNENTTFTRLPLFHVAFGLNRNSQLQGDGGPTSSQAKSILQG